MLNMLLQMIFITNIYLVDFVSVAFLFKVVQ